MSYAVYEITIQGPHKAIYVETAEGGVGEMSHVRCAVGKVGMIYEKQYFYGPGPDSLATFRSRDKKGTVKSSEMSRFEDVVEGVKTPITQFVVGRFCQCNVWIEDCWNALKADGVMQP